VSLNAMARRAAVHAAVAPAENRRGAAGQPPGSAELLATIGTYIPTEVTTAYVGAAAGMATLDPPMTRPTRLSIAIAVALLSGFLTWVVAQRKANAAAAGTGAPPPTPGATLRAGWFEILAGIVACFAWTTAVTPSWVDWGRNVVYAPALMLFLVSSVIGGAAVLLKR
jgi:hypothetical protein